MVVRGSGDGMHADSRLAAALPDNLVFAPDADALLNRDSAAAVAAAAAATVTATVTAASYLNTPPSTPRRHQMPYNRPVSSLSTSLTPSSLSSSSSPPLVIDHNYKQPQPGTNPLPLLSQPRAMAATIPTTIACERCKQKKIKCDGAQPSCSACRRAKVTCKVPDIISNLGFARGHVEALENRVSELQSLIDTKNRELKEIQSRQGSFSSFFTNSPTPSNPFTPGKRSSATSLPPSAFEPTLMHSKDDDLQADLSLARLLVQTLHLKDHGPCISKLSHLIANEKPVSFELISPSDRLPSDHIGNILSMSYLENEQVCFPFLSRHDIIRVYKEIYSAPNQIDHTNIHDYFVLYMIFAIACLSHPPGIENPQTDALRYYKAALVCKERLPLTSTLSNVQNILLLCLFSMHAKISQDAWRLSRRALHLSIEGEFHLGRKNGNVPSLVKNIQQSDREKRIERIKRRAFWSAYCLNRITSNLIYDRPPSMPEASIDLETPPSYELGTDNTESATISLLPCLTNLYNISTVAFTSLNSLDPPPGDAATQLKASMDQYALARNHLLEILKIGYPTKTDNNSLREVELWAPIYVTLSFQCQGMLLHQWALTAIAAQYDAVPQTVQQMTMKHCIDTITFISRRPTKFGHFRIAFVIMLRSLVVLLSALLAKEYQSIEVLMEESGEVSHQDIDGAISAGIRFLRDAGPSQGQSCAFLPALVLALRYAVYEKVLGRCTEIPFLREEGEYSEIRGDMETLYPGLSMLANEMGVASLPIKIGLRHLEEEANTADFPPLNAFGKFGDSGRELEELVRIVGWRLKVQYGVGDAGDSLRAFQERMAVDRVVEAGYVGFSGPAGFNGHHDGWDSGEGLDGVGLQFPQYFGGGGDGLKMDVDFSGFETDIITFE
ncbi:hypothetical protein TWF730_003147 [Orbilia blumenaviensis]|uniref:Zn(2)-C6 fungal-type domain-containing protein n=1 Tax=Orbilia blumenaviensis TaxID=1796055 RepID=A0AAV9U6R4_9PEZI